MGSPKEDYAKRRRKWARAFGQFLLMAVALVASGKTYLAYKRL